MFAIVSWRSSVKAESVFEVDQMLDSITSEVSPDLPQAVQVERANGDSLTIVLGAKEGCILSFVASLGDPPYFVSLGDPTAKGIFTYYVALEHHTEALASNVISEAKARQAVREFLSRSPELPSSVTWTEV